MSIPMEHIHMPSRSVHASSRGVSTLVIALAALMSIATAVNAQQTCRPVTTEALRSVNRFLNMPIDVEWLRTKGIATTDASSLTVLSVGSDAALCARIDSSFREGPITIFRAGGYLIATDVPVAPDPVTGRIKPRETTHVLVFDSSGTFAYLPGSGVGPAVPLDLMVSIATPDLVRINWRNQQSLAVNYRLQRAVGTSSFTDIGSLLAASDTIANDATVTIGTSYRYRVAAIAGDATRGYSDEVAVTIVDLGTVTKSTNGLLLRDQFNRADGSPGADWVSETGPWTIASNALQINIGYFADGVVRLAGLPVRKDFHIQVMSSRSQLGNYAAVYARRVGGTLYLADLGSSSEQGGKPRMYRQTNGTYTVLGYGTFLSTANTMHRLTFSVLGSERRSWSNGALQVSVTDATPANDIAGSLSLNAYGSGAAGTVRFDDLIINSSRSVTIAGLPAAHRLRVAGLLSSRSTNGADVAVDLLGTPLPADRIEILDANDVMVKIFTPADGVWGGDRYSLNGAP